MAKPCKHVPDDFGGIAEPWPVAGCAECLDAGHREWVHLRVCQTCGHVGCCDNSPGRHSRAHATETGHPLIRSYEPGEHWWYCYHDDLAFNVHSAPPAPSYT